ncbi:hypothetical protein ACFL4C_00605 [Candidatus Omnitrophota bacterium]
MEKKRSKGVTFWGWVFIIFAIPSLLQAINPQQCIQTQGIGILYLSLIMSVAYLICGVFVLKLNETARKAAIFFGIISILSIPFYMKPALNAENYNYGYAKKKQMIIEQMKPEYQQKALEDLEEVKQVSKKVLPILVIVLSGFILVFELIPIYFFTRPKVKEQFK